MARSNQDFDQFVKRQQRLAEKEKAIDWKKVREEWLQNLRSLYGKVHSHLDEYIQDGAIRIDTQPMTLTEVDIGTYEVEKKIIHIGSQVITLTPAGTMLIGSKGRVDVKGPAGSARFVMVDKDATGAGHVVIRIADPKASPSNRSPKKAIDWTWKIATQPPAIRYIDLNEESLRRLLLEVSNG
jgi:hypothetical protein